MRLFNIFLLVLCLLLPASISAMAQEFKPPTKNVSTFPEGTYKLDASHTSVLFKISHLGFSDYIGRFNTVSGTLNFAPRSPQNSALSITIDPKSVDTNNSELEGKLWGADYFNIEKFSDINFVSKRIDRSASYQANVVGELTMMGVTKPLTLYVTFNGGAMNPFSQKQTLGFSARGTLKRSDWGMAALIPVISDEVELLIEAEFAFDDKAERS